MRIGYAICHPEIAAAFDRVRNHFGVSRIAQEAAIAALGDAAHLSDVIARTASARDRIAGLVQDHGLTPLPSATNFVTVDCGGDGAFAKRILEALIERGIFVRMPGAPHLDRCIRIGAGSEADLDALAAALPSALDRVRG